MIVNHWFYTSPNLRFHWQLSTYVKAFREKQPITAMRNFYDKAPSNLDLNHGTEFHL